MTGPKWAYKMIRGRGGEKFPVWVQVLILGLLVVGCGLVWWMGGL